MPNTHRPGSLMVLLLLTACTPKATREEALAGCAAGGSDSALIAGCLTERFKWSAESAGATAHHISDSVAIAVQRLREDSIAAAQAEAVLAGANSATDQAKVGKPSDDVALGMIWVGSKRTRLYYRGHCAAARAVRGADREEFSNDKMAEKEGYQRSTAPADQSCYQAPGF